MLPAVGGWAGRLLNRLQAGGQMLLVCNTMAQWQEATMNTSKHQAGHLHNSLPQAFEKTTPGIRTLYHDINNGATYHNDLKTGRIRQTGRITSTDREGCSLNTSVSWWYP